VVEVVKKELELQFEKSLSKSEIDGRVRPDRALLDFSYHFAFPQIKIQQQVIQALALMVGPVDQRRVST
jgi:hypothetical protein